MSIVQKNGKIKVRWLIAHFPLELFIRTAKAFSKELNTLCPGQFDIEIHTTESFRNKYGKTLSQEQLAALSTSSPAIAGLEESKQTALGSNKELNYAKDFEDNGKYWYALFDALKEQKFEMSQTQVNIVGHWLDKNFHAIDLPYLFQSHDHVSQTLDGEIGERISNRVAEKTGLRAIGYTYSGGYRIVGSTEGITCLNDLQTKKFISFTSPSRALFDFASINNIPRTQASAADIADMSEEGGAIETTYLRFAGKNVLKTNHSMFMTTILTSDEFLNTLTPAQREAFTIAAHRVSKIERAWSVEDAAKYEANAEAKGITIVPINEQDEQRLRAAAKQVMDPEVLESLSIDPVLVDDIVKLGRTLH
jgi:hypothetical protein